MTIANFKDMIAGYINRTAASLNNGTTDFLLQAMNDARRQAQRDHEFELNRTENAFLTTSQAGANWQTGCKTTPGGATAILMRRVDEVWNYSTETAPSTCYIRSSRIPYSYSGQFKRINPIASNTLITNPQNYYNIDQFAYSIGSQLYITRQSASTAYKLVGIQWLDDFVTGAESPDIFLTYFVDWFKWATLGQLNVYLKDSERFNIDAALLDRSWQSVKAFDGQVRDQGESVDLS